MKWQMVSITRKNNHSTATLMRGIDAGCALCSSGSIEISINNKSFRLQQNQLFIYPPYATIEVVAVDRDFECIVLGVDHQFLLHTLKAVSWSNNLKFISDNPITYLSEYYSHRIHKLLDLIYNNTTYGCGRMESLSERCLKQAFTYEVLAAFTHQAKLPTETKTSKDSIILRFQAILKQECVRHRNVDYYASVQGLTPRYFSTIIRKMTGKTASHWIINAVVVEAQHLMLDYSISLKEITFRLNFSSQTFFSRWYKQYTGETPTQFRKRNKI